MGLISAERRTHLRQLKVEFDAAYECVDASMDRSDLAYRVAEQAYREWHQAIDRDALDLLEDLERALEETDRLRGRLANVEPDQVYSAVAPTEDEVAAHFSEISASAHLTRQIAPDIDPFALCSDEALTTKDRQHSAGMGLLKHHEDSEGTI